MKKTILLFFIAIFYSNVFSQINLEKKSFDMYSITFGYISKNNKIEGYYHFYSIDVSPNYSNSLMGKNGKKIVNFGVDILDENGNKINTFTFKESIANRLLESAYNDNKICFNFFNPYEKELNYKVFDVKGTMKLDYSVKLDNIELQTLISQQHLVDEEPGENFSLFSLEEKDFLAIIPNSSAKKRGFKLLKLSGEGISSLKTFEYTANNKFNLVEFIGNKNGVGYFKVDKYDGVFAKEITVNILALDYNTWNKKFETDGETLGENIFMPVSLVDDPYYNSIKFVGQYYKNDDNVFKDVSQGLALWELSPSGVLLKEKYNFWQEDFKGFLNFNKNNKAEDFGFLFLHKTLTLKDGKIVAVGEGYSKVADGAGIALNALGALAGGSVSSGGNTKLKITDLAVFEFDKDFNFLKGDTYKKNHNSGSVGSDFLSAHLMANILKRYGAFDYNFTSVNEDRSEYIVSFNDIYKKNFLKADNYKNYFLRFSGNNIIKDDYEIIKEKKKSKKLYANQFQKLLLKEYDATKKEINYKIIKLK